MNRLSEVEEQPRPYSSAGNTGGLLEDEVLQLFSPPESMSQAEQELSLRVASLVHGFLRATDVSSDASLLTLAEKFRESRLPVEPSRAVAYLDYLAENVVAHSTRTASPRFIGHMTTALPYFVRQLAQLMTAMNQNVVKLETAKALSFYERQTLAMMHRLVFGLPGEFYEQHVQDGQSTLGAIVSGGTLANLTALWCARNAALGTEEGFAGVEAEGMAVSLKHYGYEDAVVIGSQLMHFSFDKAAGLLGFGTRQLVKVPVDRHHRIDLAALKRTIAEYRQRKHLILALVGVAGTTDSGAIDPLAEMADIAHEAGIHFHVDAAWSGPVLFSQRHRDKLAGLERADSVTIDGHKQLYLPMGIGLVMLRDPHLAKVIEKQARYIVRPGSIDLGKRSLEGSRPGTVLFLHAALNIIGARGYEFLIEEGIRKTRYMAKLVADRPEFQLLLEPEINILLYRYIPEAWREKAATNRLTEDDDLAINLFNERLQKTQRQAGYSFVSRTSLDSTRDGGGSPVVALRAVIANPLTTESDIESVLREQIDIAARLSQEK